MDKTIESVIKFISDIEENNGAGSTIEFLNDYENEIELDIEDIDHLHDALEFIILQDEQGESKWEEE